MRPIDADALMSLYENAGTLNIDSYKVPVPVVRQNIMDAPTLDYAPVVHAAWLWDGNRGTCCSCCKTPIPSVNYYSCDDELAEEEIDETPFCPNCGAKMDGGKKDV